MIESKSFQYEDIRLSYHQSGRNEPEAPKLLLFHGFGQDQFALPELEQHLGKAYKVYSFDLFYHGSTYIPSSLEPLDPETLFRLFQNFFTYESIGKFSIAAFSMGGKIAVQLMGFFTEKIEKSYLIAADGILLSPWYKLFTSNRVIRYFFKYTIHEPKIHKALVQALYKTRLAPKSTLKFSETQMKRRAQRFKVYKSWAELRKLRISFKRFKYMIQSSEMEVYVFSGSHDKIIPPKIGYLFAHGTTNIHHKVIPSGHNDLPKRCIDSINL